MFNAIRLCHDILWSFTTLRRLPCDVLCWHLDTTCLAMNTASRCQYTIDIEESDLYSLLVIDVESDAQWLAIILDILINSGWAESVLDAFVLWIILLSVLVPVLNM